MLEGKSAGGPPIRRNSKNHLGAVYRPARRQAGRLIANARPGPAPGPRKNHNAFADFQAFQNLLRIASLVDD